MATFAGIRFENAAAAAGLNHRWKRQSRPIRILETVGRGCAFLDYDNDGWQDILLVDDPHPVLYRNLGNGRFQDVTSSSGLDILHGDWKGCAIGDYDGDGYFDILLSGYHCLALLRNDQNGHFTEVTSRSGLDPKNHGRWALSAGFMDLDGSGDLSLVICNYVKFGPSDEQFCMVRGARSGCPVDHYNPDFPEVWQNEGGRFRDVTDRSGIKSAHGRAMVLAFADVAGTGRMDFYIGNDGLPAELMRNSGGMRFKNAGISSGAAYGPMEHPIAAMGADWGDYDRDGRMDLAVTAFSDEPFSLLRNTGKGMFENQSDATNIAGQTYHALGFGIHWLDMDNDGWLDLACANGHVYDTSEEMNVLTPFREPMILMLGTSGAKGREFIDIAPKLGPDVGRPLLGRGLAVGDFDNDGRMDILVVDYEGQPVLLHNMSSAANHWITLDLRGAGANRFAYGAQVTAQAGSQKWAGHVSPASSYLSSSDPRVHFGLGAVPKLDSITIRWADGKTDVLRDVPADKIVKVVEGKPSLR